MKKFRIKCKEYNQTWEVSLTHKSKEEFELEERERQSRYPRSTPSKWNEEYSNTIHFRAVIDGETNYNPYWHHAYFASTLFEDFHSGRGICLHGGGTYEDGIYMSGDALDKALNKVKKHLKGGA